MRTIGHRPGAWNDAWLHRPLRLDFDGCLIRFPTAGATYSILSTLQRELATHGACVRIFVLDLPT